jgi:hypothetical protein
MRTRNSTSARSRPGNPSSPAEKSARGNPARLRRRAAQSQNEVPPQNASPGESSTISIGGFQIPTAQFGNMEGTVRTVVSYVQQNPVAAAAVALGAGVMLTSMYWDQVVPGKTRR